MYNKELLESIKAQGEGLVDLKRDYKIVLEEEKKANPKYEYSKVNSVVFDGVNSVKIIYANKPADNEDFLNRYTDLKNLVLTLDQINSLKFID